MFAAKISGTALAKQSGSPADARSGWWLASRVMLSGFAVVATAAQYRLWNVGEVSALEWMPFFIAILGFVVLVWTRWRAVATAVVLLGYIGLVVLPGNFNSGLWFVALPFCVEVNTRRPAWLGLSAAVVLTVGSVVDWGEGLASSLVLVIYIWSLSLLGMFIRVQRREPPPPPTCTQR
ncbi:MAG TPA: hypothetical protein PKE40_14695 [Arachnia sp.]|nr:hypothetical protein [Arachnia sp.]HMT87592.1 hypothetical protein [Arachnia sp.]